MPTVITTPSSSTAVATATASPARSSLWDGTIHKAALANDLQRCQWLLALTPSLLEARGFNGCVRQ